MLHTNLIWKKGTQNICRSLRHMSKAEPQEASSPDASSSTYPSSSVQHFTICWCNVFNVRLPFKAKILKPVSVVVIFYILLLFSHWFFELTTITKPMHPMTQLETILCINKSLYNWPTYFCLSLNVSKKAVCFFSECSVFRAKNLGGDGLAVSHWGFPFKIWWQDVCIKLL